MRVKMGEIHNNNRGLNIPPMYRILKCFEILANVTRTCQESNVWAVRVIKVDVVNESFYFTTGSSRVQSRELAVIGPLVSSPSVAPPLTRNSALTRSPFSADETKRDVETPLAQHQGATLE